MRIEAVLGPAEIDVLRADTLAGATCVVFDVLRATSTIITALANGAEEVYPVCTIEEALALKQRIPDAALAGERWGDPIPGFAFGNSPHEFVANVPRQIITTTTNGTVALRACDGAETVLVGTLLNMAALQGWVRENQPGRLVLICAGTFREVALEDVTGAGMLAAQFPDADLDDGALIALATYQKWAHDPAAALARSRNGRTLLSVGRDHDVQWCGQVSQINVLGWMDSGAVRAQRPPGG